MVLVHVSTNRVRNEIENLETDPCVSAHMIYDNVEE